MFHIFTIHYRHNELSLFTRDFDEFKQYLINHINEIINIYKKKFQNIFNDNILEDNLESIKILKK